MRLCETKLHIPSVYAKQKRKNSYLRIVKNLYRILRSLVVALLLLCVASPMILYVALSLSGVQGRIARVCEQELSTLLGCEVKVGGLGIVPFNRVVLRNVAVITAPADTALTVHRLGAGVRLVSLLTDDPVTIDYVELNGMDARLHRDSAGAPLNIQPIIDALKPRDKNKPPTAFDLKINTVMIRSSAVSYHEGTLPDSVEAGMRMPFSPKHIEVGNLRADLRLPCLRNDTYAVQIKRMGFEEKLSGFVVDNLTATGEMTSQALALRNVKMLLPRSEIELLDMRLDTPGGITALRQAIESGQHRVGLAPGSHVCLADFAAFVPELAGWPVEVNFNTLEASGNTEDFTFSADISADGHTTLALDAHASSLFHAGERNVRLHGLQLRTSGTEVARELAKLNRFAPRVLAAVAAAGETSVDIDAALDKNNVSASLTLDTGPGSIEAGVKGMWSDPKLFSLAATASTKGSADLSGILPDLQLQQVDAALTASLSRRGSREEGSADIEVNEVMFRGARYSGLTAHAALADGVVRGNAAIDNDFLAFNFSGGWSLDPSRRLVEADITLDRFIPSHLNLTDKLAGVDFSGEAHIALEGADFSHLDGSADLSRVRMRRPDGEELTLHSFRLDCSPELLTLRSDFIDGELHGNYNFASIVSEARSVFATIMPALASGIPGVYAPDGGLNDFSYAFTLKDTERPARFFGWPLSIIYPVHISGAFSAPEGDVALNISAPYLRQGSRLIEDTAIGIFAGGADAKATFDFTTTMPTKGGPMLLMAQAQGIDDRIDTSISWKIDRERAYEGEVGINAAFSRPDGGAPLLTTVDIKRSQLTFNDSTWTVNPAKVRIFGKDHIDVDGIDVHRANQFVRINGSVDPDPWQQLTLDMRNFSLDYLFESLGIDKVMLGGDATGTFTASSLLSSAPVLQTPGLSVKGISYNKTVIGDALVKASWEPETRAITLGADIDTDEHRPSKIYGAIYPMADSLDITFDVQRVKASFLQPFMSAFCSDLQGRASGKVRLFGNFKYIDLVGAAQADSLSMRINFTNTTYTVARDSVHFRPGLISLDGITVADAEGHTARLNGWVRHSFFKEPRFDFTLGNAYDFLCYNTTPRDNPVWYGKIYGNGSAAVKGYPGVVDISVDMSTAPRSTFTFVLSDREVAEELSFLTFRDRNAVAAELTDTIHERDTSMDLVNRLRSNAAALADEAPSNYNISLQMRVTPDARLNLVMDPVGGDRIRANGSGHLRLDYGSANNDLRMHGTYTLERGNYNFTLQDIIIKDFTIKPGSRINFSGDPYNAALDISAVYALNANLSDLDESFLQDKDLNRTNVPVHAVLNVTGDLVAPDIAFDLEFPTLTTDIYRKVRSIISTDDMMNRQIIYLLALNRFYTPDYMASTTKGNELVSVASSTISSQLSNILGSLSENWNIAPTFRSDRGDFSDVEVDVALSSRLLNNRLLFNGNFGYRDNALNSSQFIGDFDLEYLLDRPGMWRLKAYNRYNDQNYYLRTALTTQGVGIVLKKDFDSFLSFLRPFWRRKKDNGPKVPEVPLAPADTLSVEPLVRPAPEGRTLPVPHTPKAK